MDDYIQLLIEKMHEARERNRANSNNFESDMVDETELFLPKFMNEITSSFTNMDTLGNQFGIPSNYFPPDAELNDDQVRLLISEMLFLWSSFNIESECLFPELPQRILYTEMLKCWNDKYPRITGSNGILQIKLCSNPPEQCPFPDGYCMCKSDNTIYGFLEMNLDGKKDYFQKLMQKELGNMTFLEKKELGILTDLIYTRVTYEDEVKHLTENFKKEFFIPLTDKEDSNEYFGINNDYVISENDFELIDILMDLIEEDPNVKYEEEEILENRIGSDIPFILNWKLKIFDTIDPPKFEREIKKYMFKYPRYSLFKLTLYLYNLMNCEDIDKVGIIDFASTFEGRSAIKTAEMSDFIEKRALYYLKKNDLVSIEALYNTAKEIDLKENAEIWSYFILLVRSTLLIKHLSEKVLNI
ncbi:MAG: hypothetical protein P4L34_10355 [Paludibacter sp.]|nr:hypothetical protein [Paludibacter sp.]